MIKSMIVKEIKLTLKEKGTFFWLLVMPIMFIVLFGSILGNIGSDNAISLNYIDQDKTKESAQFIQSLIDKGGFKLTAEPESAFEEQVDRIRSGKGTALIVFPAGFGADLQTGGGQTKIELYRDATADSAIAPVRAVLENIAGGYREARIDKALAETGKSQDQIKELTQAPFQVADHRENAETYDAISQVVPGYTVMFVFFVNISMIRRFIKDKESGMTARLRTTAMKPLSYLIGMWIPYTIIALVQCTILLGFGHFVYGLHLGNIAAVALLVIVLALCGTAIGLALSVLVRSENMGMAFTQLLTMGGAVLGGLWFPIAFMPQTIQTIGHFTPQYWAQRGLQDVMVHGADIAGVWASLAVLAGIAALALVVALGRYKTFLKTALG